MAACPRSARAQRLRALLALLALAACDSPGARYQQARDLAVAGRPREALALAARAANELPSDDPRRLKALALAADLAYLHLGDVEAAVRHYRRLAEEAPGTEEAFTARARLGDLYRERLGDLTAALEQYQALVAAFPGRPEIDGYRLRIARAYLALKDYEQARADARALFEASEGELADDAHFLYASAFQAEGRRAEALAAYQAFVERFPKSPLVPLAWEEQGSLHAERGDDAGAILAWRRAEKGHPDPHRLMQMVARAQKRIARRKVGPDTHLTR